jgi:AcrR family transcriptional regulator
VLHVKADLGFEAHGPVWMESRLAKTIEPAAEERLLAAAEGLIFEEGFHAIRTRALAARAGLTIAMIRYCFGNVDELMVRLLQLNLDRFIGKQRELMDALDPRPSRKAVLHALLAPIDQPAAFTPGLRAGFVIEDILVHAGPTIRQTAEDRLNESIEPLLDLLVASCPHMSRGSVLWRFSCICAGSLSLSPRSPAWQLYRSLAGAEPATGTWAMEEMLALACGAFDQISSADMHHATSE